MQYLLEPTGRVRWLDLPESIVNAARENGVSVGNLPWRADTERTLEDLLPIALRHGASCDLGLVVQAIHILDVEQPEEYRRIIAQGERSHAAVRATGVEDLMEEQMPGWNARGAELDAGIAEVRKKTLAEFEKTRDELLSAPVKPELSAHWQQLGGRVS